MINNKIGEMLLIDHEDKTSVIQNKLKNKDNEKGEETMDGSKIKELFDEVELYKQAIQDAKDALASAEQELDETLAAQFKEEDQ